MAHNLAEFMYEDEGKRVEALLAGLSWDGARQARVNAKARELVERVRGAKRKTGELESFLTQYGLNSEEGLALMTLAEALLRIPDAHTANLLIRDKIVAADWLSRQGESKDLLVKAAGLGLSITKKALDSAASKLGEGAIRLAIVQAMRMMGGKFVLGRTIEEGVKNAGAYEKKGYRMSYDMLGEGARTAADAERYFAVYRDALTYIGRSKEKPKGGEKRPGMSVKLSALHPRYEFRKSGECVPALTEKLIDLARLAAANDVPLTVDAEETDRLEMSLDIVNAVLHDKDLNHWEGFGLAVQAYQKRCYPLIGRLAEMAESAKRRLQVRLVKGAYWDTEVKRAQASGLPEYPVFTRKANTDLSYIACAAKLLSRRDVFYPMLATHNAHSVAAVLELAGNDRDSFEFQRLHGMGETLHDLVLADGAANVTVYAPCGSHEDLLPYLVRRLLENGANSSFVNQLLDPETPVEDIVADPVLDARNSATKRHQKIPLPRNLYAPPTFTSPRPAGGGREGGRLNSHGLDLAQETTILPLLEQMKKIDGRAWEAAPLVNGRDYKQGERRAIKNPANLQQTVGHVWDADAAQIEKAFSACKEGFKKWSAESAETRAGALEKLADLLERNTAQIMGLCVREAGKTVDDALAEVREAVDFCRYYAVRGRGDFAPQTLPGPTGERNVMQLHGRGVFVCISPWNFPLAIFMGQVAAALMAGNAVIAKPAEQTPLIAAMAAQLILAAGVPADAFALLPGDGKVGAQIVQHKDVAGVAFTGSGDAAHAINRALAAKEGPIVPLIAETGGLNAMIVDSSALPEQAVDDAMISAFGSAGQRCSALRVLCVQDDIADKIIDMIKGAMAQRSVGDPMDIASDIGPVIDEDALAMLREHRKKLDSMGRRVAEMKIPEGAHGHFFAPCAYEIGDVSQLTREVFGPVLHIVRFAAKDIGKLVEKINQSGYGLTFGLHTRISSVMDRVGEQIGAGNAYINRTMIGAVVGVQPFGGHGLSGTGPKAGGPHYLPRFATEKVISTDTTRAGGNATLVSLME